MNNQKNNKIPILSFYSGGGFMDMGFEQAGFETVWSNEFDEVFAKLHAAGITSWRKSSGNTTKAEIFNTRSINDISSQEIISEVFPNGLPSHFGMIGGPPCQDFSINGKMKGFEGDRGKLTTLYLNKVIELQPTFFVMENVTGLIRKKESREYLQNLLERVEEHYIIDRQILNALDFGVPQCRERVFFIGIKKVDLDQEMVQKGSKERWFPFPENKDYKNSESKYHWPQSVTFGSKLKKPSELPIELCVESCLVSEKKISQVPNAREFFNLYVDEKKLNAIGEGETNRPSFKRLHRYKYSPTACYGNNEVHLHPYLNRRLSVRETLRIQGVPDSYVLPAELPLSKKFKMIGNGVPVPLAKAVAISLRNFLIKNEVLSPRNMTISKCGLNTFFDECLYQFFKKETDLILSGIAERTLCGALAIIAHKLLYKFGLKGYYSDVEFNRMQDGKIKTMINDQMEYITINCDLIVHSRGEMVPDNLLALEMKKSDSSSSAKKGDRNRLIALTKTALQYVWAEDGKAMPEYVCGYQLGIYIELNVTARKCLIERYELGELIGKSEVFF